MKIVGLITEYNPFHNGHLHHLQESLRVTGAEASVAVMSGHFLQRGEPALVDKWVRTEMALAAGVDLVLELPLPFACNSAPHFAMGAVQTLNALGVVDSLCFGSESDDLDGLGKIAELLIDEEEEVARKTGARLRQGKSYPAARAEVLAELSGDVSRELLSAPNNILGIAYLKALRQTGSSVLPQTIQRLGPGYHDTQATDRIASATGIRERLTQGEEVAELLPDACHDLLREALNKGHRLDPERLFIALQSQLLQDPGGLAGIYQVADGLDQRLTEAALTSTDYSELANTIKSRHWTLTRIQRILSYVLLRLTSEEMAAFLGAGPLYLRLLGANRRGEEILARARSVRTLPLLNDPSRARSVLGRFYKEDQARGRLAEQCLACDLRATRLYSLLQTCRPGDHYNRDYFKPVR